MLKVRGTNKNEYTDQQLFEGLMANDQKVLEYLYKKMYPMVRQQILQLGGQEEDARDHFQEGLIATWQNARSGKFKLQANTRLSTYLVQVCKWRWLEKTKKASSRMEKNMDELQEQGENPGILTRWLKKEQQQQFRFFFRQLGERCQDILKRFYFSKESMKMIAEALGLEEKSAKNQKYRCMQQLKKIYQASNQDQ